MAFAVFPGYMVFGAAINNEETRGLWSVLNLINTVLGNFQCTETLLSKETFKKKCYCSSRPKEKMSGGIQRSTSAAIKYLRGKSCWGLTLNWNTTIEMIEHCLWRVRNDATDCQKEFLENLMKLHQTHWNEHNFMLHLPTRNLYEGCTFIHLGTAETSNCRKLSGILWRKIFWLKGWTSWLLTVIADNCILLIASYQWATNLDSVSAGCLKKDSILIFFLCMEKNGHWELSRENMAEGDKTTTNGDSGFNAKSHQAKSIPM